MTDEAPVECRCPQGPGRTIPPERMVDHLRWHALVIAQGGPAGLVNAETLRQARRPAAAVDRPDPETRARIRARLVAEARRNGRHAVAERPPWAR